MQTMARMTYETGPGYQITSLPREVTTGMRTKTEKPCVLLITDNTKQLTTLRDRLEQSGMDVRGAASMAWLRRLLARTYDAVVVDVQPENLIEALETIRAVAAEQNLPVLVEPGRIANDPLFAGVLPKYRAMPCHHDQLIARLKHKTSARTIRPRRLL
ncbi:MAG: hypothetical protein ACKV2V_10245 [Blastocatellia bacterium]